MIWSVNDFSVIIIWTRGDFHKPTVQEIGPTLKYSRDGTKNKNGIFTLNIWIFGNQNGDMGNSERDI